jgi:hypothetical protein
MWKRALLAIVASIMGCKQAAAPSAGGSAGSGSGATGSAATGSAATGSAATGSAETRSAATSAPSGQSLRDALSEAAAGKPLLLALDAGGQLTARTIDDSYTTAVLQGPYDDALHDSALDLVWLRREAAIDVLDLRLPGPAAAKTLVTAPDKAFKNLGVHFSKSPHWDMTSSVVIELEKPCSPATSIVLEWSNGGVGAAPFGEGMKVVARDWFAVEEHRIRRDGPRPFTEGRNELAMATGGTGRSAVRRPTLLEVPKGIGSCHVDTKTRLGQDECGEGQYFGETEYDELVVVSANAKKCPAKQCRLYHLTSKKYSVVPGVAPDDREGRSCGPFLFDPDGTSYLIHDKVCTGQSCSSVGRLAIGWLDGARVLDESKWYLSASEATAPAEPMPAEPMTEKRDRPTDSMIECRNKVANKLERYLAERKMSVRVQGIGEGKQTLIIRSNACSEELLWQLRQVGLAEVFGAAGFTEMQCRTDKWGWSQTLPTVEPRCTWLSRYTVH